MTQPVNCLIIYEDKMLSMENMEKWGNPQIHIASMTSNPSLDSDMVSEVNTVGPQVFWGVHRGVAEAAEDAGLKTTT